MTTSLLFTIDKKNPSFIPLACARSLTLLDGAPSFFQWMMKKRLEFTLVGFPADAFSIEPVVAFRHSIKDEIAEVRKLGIALARLPEH